MIFNWDADPDFEMPSHSGFIDETDGGLRTSTSMPYPTFLEFQRQLTTVYSEIFGFASIWQGLSLNVDGGAERIGGQFVSGNYYAGLGVSAAVGRPIEPDDDRPDAPPVVVISHAYWQHRFAGNPAVVGRTLFLNSHPFTLIGVAVAGFDGALQVGESPEVTIPLNTQPLVDPRGARLDRPGRWWLQVVGRLTPGTSVSRAEAATDSVFRQIVMSNRGLEEPSGSPLPPIRLTPGGQGLNEVRSRLTHPLLVIFGVVVLVLVIACANVAGLMLARSSSVHKEIAIRVSIGCSRGRVVRQLLTESLVVALAGGGAGLAFALLGRGLIEALLSQASEFTFPLSTLRSTSTSCCSRWPSPLRRV